MKKFFEKPNFYSFLLFNLLMIWIFVLLLFSLSDSVKAASVGDDDYFFPMQQNENGHFTEIVINSINSTLDSENNYYFCEYWAIENGWFVTYFVKWPKADGYKLFAEVNNNGYLFNLYRMGGYNADIGYLRINMSDGSTGAYSTSFDHFFNMGSSVYYSGCDYISNFTLKTNDTSSANIVLRLRPIGHEVKPPRQEDPEYSSGDSAPSNVPDVSGSSSDTSLLAKTLQYYGNLINQNNNSNFQNLYENLLPQYYVFSQFYNFGLDDEGHFTLTSAIGNLFEYLFIPDPDDLTDLIESYDDFGIIDFAELSQSYWGNVKTLVTSGDSLFYIKINAFSIMGRVCGPYYIDFSWYLPFKPIGDAMISAFLVFGWFVWVYHRLPYWLRGQQGDVSGVITEVNKK